MFWKPKDAEADIENLAVEAIERHGKQTVIIVKACDDVIWLRCTLEKHNDLVMRFRKKLGLKASLYEKAEARRVTGEASASQKI